MSFVFWTIQLILSLMYLGFGADGYEFTSSVYGAVVFFNIIIQCVLWYALYLLDKREADRAYRWFRLYPVILYPLYAFWLIITPPAETAGVAVIAALWSSLTGLIFILPILVFVSGFVYMVLIVMGIIKPDHGAIG